MQAPTELPRAYDLSSRRGWLATFTTSMWFAFAWAIFGLGGLLNTLTVGAGPEGWYKLGAPVCQGPVLLLLGAGGLGLVGLPHLRASRVIVPLVWTVAVLAFNLWVIGELPGGGC